MEFGIVSNDLDSPRLRIVKICCGEVLSKSFSGCISLGGFLSIDTLFDIDGFVYSHDSHDFKSIFMFIMV